MTCDQSEATESQETLRGQPIGVDRALSVKSEIGVMGRTSMTGGTEHRRSVSDDVRRQEEAMMSQLSLNSYVPDVGRSPNQKRKSWKEKSSPMRFLERVRTRRSWGQGSPGKDGTARRE